MREEDKEAKELDRLTARGVAIGYGGALIVQDLNLTIPTGKVTALVGPNGSGKSTVLKTLARILRPQAGEVILDGKAIHAQPTREVAKKLAILPQNPSAPEGLTVAELVAYGRFPHRRGLTLTPSDRRVITSVLELTGMDPFADRPVDALSGGQRQRAWIAMALAQETDILFLDEPTSFLDITYQLEILQLLRRLNRDHNRTIVMVVHDLNLASRYADHMVVLKSGRVVTEGAPKAVIRREVLRDVFGVEADIVADPRTGVPLCLPFDLAAGAGQASVHPAPSEAESLDALEAAEGGVR